MRIIMPYAQAVPRDISRGGMRMIEMAARNCYRSEGAGDPEGFVRRLIERGHDAMLEHGDYIFRLDDYHMLDCLQAALRRHEEDTGRRIPLTVTNIDQRHIVSGTVRAWRELMQADTAAKHYFAFLIDPVYRHGVREVEDPEPQTGVHPLLYADLAGPVERAAHMRVTMRFVIDRGVSHEFVRHRTFAFAQESTRYCNYSNGKFGKEITVIQPCFLREDTVTYHQWELACESAERYYFKLLELGMKPEEARDVLPVSLKTELIMTGTLGAWEHFFDLRVRQVTGPAHPQAVEAGKMALVEYERTIKQIAVL